ncbi:complement component receptor 1-like protein isoform X2 [Sycon ciliatum]|uniref:complement component receptor 1-like protein isoform X2 n=1 Tax=Sycon ciliatum TaxID=27933 RepID=UPI0031F6B70B
MSLSIRDVVLRLLLLECITTLQSAGQHVEHFNCNSPTGLYYISGLDWSTKYNSTTAAGHKCRTILTDVSFALINSTDLSGTNRNCLLAFLAHIAAAHPGNSVSAWLYSSTGRDRHCYPGPTCSSTNVTICKFNKPEAADLTNSCPILPPITNGIITYPSGLVFPSEAFYACNIGYRLHGPSHRASRSHYVKQPGDIPVPATWDPSSSHTCNVNNCHAPRLPDGQVLGTSPYYMAKCDVGFKLVGNAQITCISDTETTPKPACQPIRCPAPSIPHSAGLMDNYSDIGQQVEVNCSRGYRLVGNSTVECTRFGGWTSLPTCEAIRCPAPSIPHSAGLIDKYSDIGQRVDLNCSHGYRLVGNSTVECEGSGGWTSLPTCEKIHIHCQAPAQPENGYLLLDGLDVHSAFNITCKEGYRSTQAEPSKCMPSGSWSNPPGKCEEAKCRKQEAPPNGEIIGYIPLAGREVFYYCNDDYELEGSRTQKCKMDGNWTGLAPACVKKATEEQVSWVSQPASLSVIVVMVVMVLVALLLPLCFILSRNRSRSQDMLDSGQTNAKEEPDVPGEQYAQPTDMMSNLSSKRKDRPIVSSDSVPRNNCISAGASSLSDQSRPSGIVPSTPIGRHLGSMENLVSDDGQDEHMYADPHLNDDLDDIMKTLAVSDCIMPPVAAPRQQSEATAKSNAPPEAENSHADDYEKYDVDQETMTTMPTGGQADDGVPHAAVRKRDSVSAPSKPQRISSYTPTVLQPCPNVSAATAATTAVRVQSYTMVDLKKKTPRDETNKKKTTNSPMALTPTVKTNSADTGISHGGSAAKDGVYVNMKV